MNKEKVIMKQIKWVLYAVSAGLVVAVLTGYAHAATVKPAPAKAAPTKTVAKAPVKKPSVPAPKPVVKKEHKKLPTLKAKFKKQ